MIAWDDYENLLVLRYRSTGMSEATAFHFAHDEIDAIKSRNHWTHGRPTTLNPQQLIFNALSPDEQERFNERAGIHEYDGGMNRADAESEAITEIISRKYPAPQEKPRSVYRGSAAIKQTVAAGIGIKEFFAKSKDSNPIAYTTDLTKIAAMWDEGKRRFKALIWGRFLVVDVDQKLGKPDGLQNFYQIFSRKILPAELQKLPESFPAYTQTPSGGFHLYFQYEGPELKLRELAPSIEIKEWQITAPGSRKENNGEYILHGKLSNAPPLYGLIVDAIEEAKRRKEQIKTGCSQPRTRTVADRPIRYGKPRITLDGLINETLVSYAGNHDRQVSFAGKACRCKFSASDALAYVKSRPDIFGNDTDTEKTIISVFRDNGALCE